MSDNFDSATEPNRSAVTPSPAPASTPSLNKVESKLVVAATLATLLYAVLETVQANTAVLSFLPGWAQGVVLAVLPGALAFLAGYRVPSNRV